MDTIGLDLHKRESQLCILAEDGTVQERRIVTSRERFTAVLGNRPKARILLEASTESEWVEQHLETPVEAGWRILRSKSEDTAALRAWALLIAARRGKRIAVVALARRLAGILYAMWRDKSPYKTANLRMPRPILAKAS